MGHNAPRLPESALHRALNNQTISDSVAPYSTSRLTSSSCGKERPASVAVQSPKRCRPGEETGQCIAVSSQKTSQRDPWKNMLPSQLQRWKFALSDLLDRAISGRRVNRSEGKPAGTSESDPGHHLTTGEQLGLILTQQEIDLGSLLFDSAVASLECWPSLRKPTAQCLAQAPTPMHSFIRTQFDDSQRFSRVVSGAFARSRVEI